jgi:hypothetical protein
MAIENKLTEADINNLTYFWEYVGDLDRFTDFERLKPILERERPEVLKAWYDHKSSIKILDIVIRSLN